MKAKTIACLAALAFVVGCVGHGHAPPDGTPSGTTLNRAVQNAMTGSGNVRAQLVDGVAIVNGNLESATDERAIERALLRIDGIEEVRMQVSREM